MSTFPKSPIVVLEGSNRQWADRRLLSYLTGGQPLRRTDMRDDNARWPKHYDITDTNDGQ
jgi:hypothetical protein